MIKNLYYLIVGILSILFSFTHAQNGSTTILEAVNINSIDPITKTSIFYVWHIITVENLVFGIFFIIIAFYKNQSKVKFSAWLIVSIMVARWIVIFGSTLLMNPDKIGDTLVDSIAILVFIGLIILGAWKKESLQS